jgi:transcription-repair coupling factor (superfamily II helicase)
MILPAVSELLNRVTRHSTVVEAFAQLRESSAAEAALTGLTDPAKTLLAAHAVSALRRPVILLTANNQRADALLEPLRYFCRALAGPSIQVAVLPAFDVLPWQGVSPHPEILESRATTLWRVSHRTVNLLVVPLAAALFRLRDAAYYSGLGRTFEPDADVAFDELLAHLTAVGYERVETADMPGQFAARGGIVDIFPPETVRPVRVELLGDTVESLREYDPATQRSVAPVVRTTLLPLTEFPRRREILERVYARGAPDSSETELREAGALPGWEFEAARLESGGNDLFQLCAGPGRPLVILDESDALDEAAADFFLRLSRDGGDSARKVDTAELFLSEEEWSEALATQQRLRLERLSLRHAAAKGEQLSTQPTTRFHGNVPAFMAEVRTRLAAGEQVMASAGSIGELERLTDLCREYELPYLLGELEDTATGVRLAEDSTAGSVSALVLTRAPLSEGVVFRDCQLVLYGTADLFEVLPASDRPKRRPKTAGFFSDFSELKAGDYVVHVDHGIGQFEGLRNLESEGARGEFMLLRYAEDARLYVPLERLDLVQNYRAMEGEAPVLDRLGGVAWAARKARVRKSLQDMADQLLRLYAARKASGGVAFSPDTAWQREFEDGFEFDETPDQTAAIAEIKRDMERALPMDRLLCGDVGYGKTEVAMRSAFKAVADSKQVAVLAPTTVLVFQHYETFRHRFAAFPMRIEMLSRFRSRREQKQVLLDLEAGKVDIVIGTHRLLSRDVRFHDLGLLIVDEEQRFGVAHKERLKELKKDVDALALSATPIPRTLHMSLAGLRDMSVIETPPKDRLAIQTVVAPFQESLIQRAIQEELARKGQVFFIHNRVESIYSIAELVQKLAPKARVVVGHGQMGERELERVMLKFVRDEADVLVSTTIVENGLDIPRANTILINRADRFGLGELYQLRGRVGRSNQRAYAYLLVPPEASLSDIARRRLAALKEFSELGSGFRIAALDLELRGAGNLLGRQQHGHINAIGFDLYCQMLERAVAALKGEKASPELRCTLNLGLDIRIPSEYIESENLRLRTYKRIAGVTTDAEKEEVVRELADRFGPLPPAVTNLLEYAVLKAECEKLLVSSAERQGDRVAVKFHPETPLDPSLLVRTIGKHGGLRLDPSGAMWLEWKRGQGGLIGALRNVLLELQPQG